MSVAWLIEDGQRCCIGQGMDINETLIWNPAKGGQGRNRRCRVLQNPDTRVQVPPSPPK